MTKPLTIAGVVFQAPLKFSEGHRISANEAAALNAQLHSDLAAKMRGAMAKAQKAVGEGVPLEAEAVDKLQQQLRALAAVHDFSPKSANTFDPVQREGLKMIRPLVLNALKKKGMDPKTLADGKLEEILLAGLMKRPDIMAEAQRRVSAVKDLAGDLIGIE